MVLRVLVLDVGPDMESGTMSEVPKEVVHKFYDSLRIGEQFEEVLDTYFGQWFRIADATMDQQMMGIDRIFTKPTGARYSVEYKADIMAAETGNFAIETVSVLTDEGELKKHGWALTSTAQLVMLYIPGKKVIYIVDMMKLRTKLPEWQAIYKEFTALNEGYSGKGVLVPETVIAKMCDNRLEHP